MKKNFQQWWDGEYIPYENDPNDGFFIIGGDQVRHWTSDFTHRIWNFIKVEWKWVIGFLLTCTGLVMTYIRFF